MQLFNSLNVTVDAFREIRRDIFQQRYSIPNYLGTASTAVYGNLAKVKNYGFDLSLDYGKQINKDLAIQFKGHLLLHVMRFWNMMRLPVCVPLCLISVRN